MKNLQQTKVSREIQGTSYDADDEDVFPESTTEEDSDDIDLNEWERESEFESTTLILMILTGTLKQVFTLFQALMVCMMS